MACFVELRSTAGASNQQTTSATVNSAGGPSVDVWCFHVLLGVIRILGRAGGDVQHR